MNRFIMFVIIAILVLSLGACGGGGSGASVGGSSAGSFDTEFPLPDSVSNFTDTGGVINFQTNLSLEDSVSFYRAALGNAGLTERTINTAITETTFSLVFDGDPSGKAVVVQGVDLGGGTTNINIRYEAV